MTNLEKLLLFAFAFPLVFAARAWVWSTAWNWAVTPVFGTPHSTILQAAVVVLGAIAVKTPSDRDTDMIRVFLEFVLRSLVLLTVAAIIGRLA